MKLRFLCLSAAAVVMMAAACTKEDTAKDDDNGGQTEIPEDQNNVSGDVEGEWTANSTVNVTGHITVPEGKSLTIEEGVNVIFSEAGVGANHAPIEFTVKGNLYVKGSASNRVLFSVKESLRTSGNIFNQDAAWGGIVAMESCGEMLIDYAVIEYTGGPVIEGSPAATNGIYTAGDDAYPQITISNINGRYVVTNSIIRNGWSDGIYLMGGSAIIAGNIFAANGYDGGEAVNVKAGCKADVAGNVIFSPNTNGLKLSSSGQSTDRGQAKIQSYNNTIINAGWRRDGEKGGCIYIEKNVLANTVNNLLVNCKFRAMTPKYTSPGDPEKGYDSNSVIDYNYYASGSQRSSIVYDGEDESGVAYAWEGYNYAHENYNPAVDTHSIIATSDDSKDPEFVNFGINGVSLTEYVYNESWDFHLSSGSPALSGADGSLAPYFSTAGLNVGGAVYTSPALKKHFGAFGAN